MLSKLICWWKGCKRGLRITPTGQADAMNNMVRYRCPRCGATHTRKAKGKA